jgi:O-antigen/teichoic acid export membrane protein
MMKLRNFTLGVGLGCSLLTLFFGLTGLDRLYFRHVIGASELSFEYAHQGLMLCAALPFLNAGMSYLRGMLMLAKNSTARLWAMVFGLGILVLVLSVGVGMGGSGMVVAAAGLIAWAAAECGVLWLGHRRNPVSWPSSQPR